MAATHFHEIFENRLVRSCPELTFAHMLSRVIDDDLRSGNEPITFLYQLEIGRSNESMSTRCAAMNGVDRAIIEEADRLAEVQTQGGGGEEECCRPFEDELRDLQRAEVIDRTFVESEVLDQSNGGQPVRQWLRDILGH